MKLIIIFLVCSILLMPAAEVNAEALNSLTVRDLINKAWENNQSLQEARHKYESARYLYKQAESGRDWRSDVIFDGSAQKTSKTLDSLYSMAGEELDDAYISTTGTLAFSKILRDTDSNLVDLKMAEQNLNEKKESLREKELEIIINVQERFYELQEARSGVELAKKAVEYQENNLERKKRELEADRITDRKITEATAELEDAKATLDNTKDLLRLAELDLQRLTGIEGIRGDHLISISSDSIEDAADPNPWPWGYNEMIEIAQNRRPEIRRAKAGEEVANIELKETKANTGPDLSLNSSIVSTSNRIRLGAEVDEDYRFIGSISRLGSTLPDVDKVEIDDDNWEEVTDNIFDDDPPFWFPDKDDAQNIITPDGPEDYYWEVGFALSYNIFDSGLDEARINEKKEELKASNTVVNDAKDMITLDIKQKYDGLKAKDRNLKAAKADYDFARQRYNEVKRMEEIEMATIEEKELAELGYHRSLNNLKTKVFNYMLARAELGAALGLDSQELIYTF